MAEAGEERGQACPQCGTDTPAIDGMCPACDYVDATDGDVEEIGSAAPSTRAASPLNMPVRYGLLVVTGLLFLACASLTALNVFNPVSLRVPEQPIVPAAATATDPVVLPIATTAPAHARSTATSINVSGGPIIQPALPPQPTATPKLKPTPTPTAIPTPADTPTPHGGG